VTIDPELGRPGIAWEQLVDVFVDSSSAVAALIDSTEVERSWTRPSSLDGWSVGGIAGHLVTSVGNTAALLDRPIDPNTRLLSVAEYYGANRADGPVLDDPIAQFIRDDGEKRAAQGPAAVAVEFRGVVDAVTPRLRGLSRDHRIPTSRIPDATTTIDVYLVTRLIELAVHGDDLAVGAGVAWSPPPLAGMLAAEMLLGLAIDRVGSIAVLRAFARAERADSEDLRVL
jgi:uncharacterized protein (TIGR03083 family)